MKFRLLFEQVFERGIAILAFIFPFMEISYYFGGKVFLNTESTVFDRNRVYGGFGYQINKNIRVEAGYLSQLFETSSRDQFNLITFVNF